MQLSHSSPWQGLIGMACHVLSRKAEFCCMEEVAVCQPAIVSASYQRSFQSAEHGTGSVRVCMSVRASGEHAEGFMQAVWVSYWMGATILAESKFRLPSPSGLVTVGLVLSSVACACMDSAPSQAK